MYLWQQFKSGFHLESVAFRYALRLSVACFIAQLLVFIFNVQAGYWVILTIVVCMLHTIGRTLKRSVERMFGTFIGALLAVYIAKHLGQHFHVLEGLIFILLFFAYYSRAFDYGLSTIFLTPAIILFVHVINRGAWDISWFQFSSNILWGLLVVMLCFLIFPSQSNSMLKKYFNQDWEVLRGFLEKFINKLGEEKLDSALFENDISDRLSELFFVVKEAEIESFLQRRTVRSLHGSYAFIARISGYLEIILADISFEVLVPKNNEHLEVLRQGLIHFYDLMGEVSYHNNVFYLSASGKEQYELLVSRLTENIAVFSKKRIAEFKAQEVTAMVFTDLIRLHIALEHLLEATHCFAKMKTDVSIK